MSSIRERFLNAADDFLTGVTEGTPAIERFSEEWSILRRDFDLALRTGTLDDDTMSLACEASSRVAIYASAFHDLFFDVQRLTSDLMNELETSFSRLTLADFPHPHDTSDTDRNSLPSPISSCTLFDDIVGDEPLEFAACSWLLANLNNPYPRSAVKDAIARSAKVGKDEVSQWFKHTRSKIGWTDLRIQRFHGSRREITHAASLAFTEDQPCKELSEEDSIAFSQIRSRAFSLMQPLEPAIRHPDNPSDVSHPQRLLDTISSSPYIPPVVYSLSDEIGHRTSDSVKHGLKRPWDGEDMHSDHSRSALTGTVTKRGRNDAPLIPSNIMQVSDGCCPPKLAVSEQDAACSSQKPSYVCDLQLHRKRQREDEEDRALPVKRLKTDEYRPETQASNEINFSSPVSLDIQTFSDWYSLGILDDTQCCFESSAVAQTVHLSLDPGSSSEEHNFVAEPVVWGDGLSELIQGGLEGDDLTPWLLCDAATQENRTQDHDVSASLDWCDLLVTFGHCASTPILDELPLYNPIDNASSRQLLCAEGISPPPFTEGICDISTNDCDDFGNALAYSFDAYVPPPPPYETANEATESYFDIVPGKFSVLQSQNVEFASMFGTNDLESFFVPEKSTQLPETIYSTL